MVHKEISYTVTFFLPRKHRVIPLHCAAYNTMPLWMLEDHSIWQTKRWKAGPESKQSLRVQFQGDLMFTSRGSASAVADDTNSLWTVRPSKFAYKQMETRSWIQTILKRSLEQFLQNWHQRRLREHEDNTRRSNSALLLHYCNKMPSWEILQRSVLPIHYRMIQSPRTAFE